MKNKLSELKILLSKPSLIGGFLDTRTNGEDFAITPYLFGFCVNGEVIKNFGFGICWGYYSVCIGLGWNIPISVPKFQIKKHIKHKHEK